MTMRIPEAMPGDGQEHTGVVKSFNFDKGWGFVSSDTYPRDVFLLKSNNDQGADTGDTVSFQVHEDSKGPKAVHVAVLQKAAHAASAVTVENYTGEMYNGVVRSYTAAKGWGFINTESYEGDVFLRKAHNPQQAGEGDHVYFGIVEDEKGPQAVNVHVTSRKNSASASEGPEEVQPTHRGVVKSFNFEKGWGFITPDGMDKDVFLLKSANEAMAGKDDIVSFTISQDDKGPHARNVKVVQKGDGSYKGVIQSFNEQKGFGFIKCEETEKIFNKDIFFLKTETPKGALVTTGMAVYFQVQETDRGAQANNIRIVGNQMGQPPHQQGFMPMPSPMGGMSSPMDMMANPALMQQMFQVFQQFAGGMVPGGMAPIANQPHAQPRRAIMNGGAPGNQFGAEDTVVGTLKSFNDTKGYGFVQMNDGQDIFFLRQALGGAMPQPGETVQCTLHNTPKGVQAASVTPMPAGGMPQFGRPQHSKFSPAPPKPTSNNIYAQPMGASGSNFSGVVKSFNPEKQWGFITCEAALQQYGSDVFLHSKECHGRMPAIGDQLSFTVDISPAGKPVAKNLVFAGSNQSMHAGSGPPRRQFGTPSGPHHTLPRMAPTQRMKPY